MAEKLEDAAVAKNASRKLIQLSPFKYEVVKAAGLKAYELVPEAYRQKFC